MNKSTTRRTLEDRMLVFILLASIVVSVLLVTENIIIDFPFVANYKWFFMFVLSSILLYFVLKRLYVYPIKLFLFIVYIFFLLPFGWLSTGTNNSFTVAYSFLIYISISFLFKRLTRFLLMTSEVFVVLAMFFLEAYHPEFFTIVPQPIQELDLLIQVVITFLWAGIILSVFSNAYQKEKQSLKEYTLLLDQQNKVLENLSMIDELTQAYNRRYFFNYLNNRPKKECLIGMMDIDYFKSINDDYGHDMGDHVLIYISESLRELLGSDGIIARYGGDEFAIVYEQTDPQMQRDLLSNINELNIIIEKLNHPVSLSGGFTKYDGFSPVDDVIQKADKLLYQVKSNGKNNIIIG